MPSRPLLFPTPPSGLTFGDVLQRLAILAPDDLRALETLARACLADRWPGAAKRPLKAYRESERASRKGPA